MSAQDGRENSVLLVLSSLGIGGSETKFVKLAGALAARGTKVAVAYLDPPLDLLPRIDPSVTVIPLRRRGKFSPGALRRLIAAIGGRDASTVISVNLYASLYVALASLVRRFRFIASVNTTDFIGTREKRQMRLYRHLLRRADLLVFGAEIQRRVWAERYGLGRDRVQTAVLYNGVDTDHFAPGRFVRDGKAPPRTRYLIGTVGRLRPEKAHTHLVRATAALRAAGLDVGALIVGEGSERAAIEAQVRECDLEDYVVLTGATDDVRPYLARMDVFVLPSIGVETFSNAVLEALAMGIPVVSSTAGGMQELLAWGGGVTYPPGDVKRLTAILGELIPDTERRRVMSEIARRGALERFRFERTVETFACFVELADAADVHGPCRTVSDGLRRS